nr:succinate dehydrogenase cytochrome b subunit [Geotalea sp. SG265]
MGFFSSSVGRKMVMAVTGQAMVLFVIVHLIGNSLIFEGPDGINAYAEHLRRFPPLVWMFRLSMLVFFVTHAWYGIRLTLENRAAKPHQTVARRYLTAGFAGETMIWTGLLLGIFVIFHLLQFTIRVTPDVVQKMDAAGRYDVFAMVVASFRRLPVVSLYVAAMAVLFLHLVHGIQSFFQTMGWSSERSRPVIIKVGSGLAVIFLAGYSAIPLSVLLHIVG